MSIIPEQPLDNGGRRTGGDRRKYSYSGHIPERRSENERRCGEDRRKKMDFETTFEQRSSFGG